MLTGKVLDDSGSGVIGTLHAAIKRLGEPVIRTAVGQAMREMGRQFVLGETIEGAMTRAQELEDQDSRFPSDQEFEQFPGSPTGGGPTVAQSRFERVR